tara:strand:+ start:5750 stop:6526 length:777 start_codon:yes stop_codon:yes gene_type:complete
MARIEKSSSYEIHPEEAGEGVVLGWFDHGIETHPKYGDKHKVALKIMSTTHSYVWDGEDEKGKPIREERPFVLTQKVNLATGERSTCYKLRRKLLGRALRDSENGDLALVTETDPESQGISVRYEIEHNKWAPPGGEEMTFANIVFLKVTEDAREIKPEELELSERIQEAIFKRIEAREEEEENGGTGQVDDLKLTAINLITFLGSQGVYDKEKAENYKAFVDTASNKKLEVFIARCEKDAKDSDLKIPVGTYDGLPF